MQTLAQIAAPVSITTGATALLFIINPWVFYGSLTISMITCVAICWQIIVNCDKRNKRLDALNTRATRRAANAKCKCGDNKPPC